MDNEEALQQLADQFRDDVEELTKRLDTIQGLRGRINDLEAEIAKLKAQKENYVKKSDLNEQIPDNYIPIQWYAWIGSIILIIVTISQFFFAVMDYYGG